MSVDRSALIWTQPAWLDQAHTWIRQSLQAAGYRLIGPLDQFHIQVWSTLMRCPTDQGMVYFKASPSPVEVRLTRYLARIQPANLPEIIAVNPDETWMLMRDAGDMLRAYLKSPADLPLVEPALVDFARLQIRLSTHGDNLLALGASDHRLERLPELFADLLDSPMLLRLGAADGLSAGEVEQLRSTLPQYETLCRRLITAGVPQTLQHDDFHDGNIFVTLQEGAFHYIFSDWEESCLAHPFFSLMQCLRSVGYRAGYPDQATEKPEAMPPELNRLRDVYLQQWQDFAGLPKLLEIFNQAWRVGMVSRALSWSAFVSGLDQAGQDQYGYTVPAWLKEYLLAVK